MTTTINVQFADATEKVVIAYFSCPQDPIAWPNQGQLPSTDARWLAFYDAQPVAGRFGLPAPGA